MPQALTLAPTTAAFDNQYQVVWDSTSLQLAMTCPYKYYLTMYQGYGQHSIHLTFGAIYAEVHQLRRNKEAEGMAADEILHLCVAHILNHPDRAKLEAQAERAKVKNKTTHTLIRTVCWYFFTYADDSLRTVKLNDGTVASEQSFKMPHALDENILLSGHFDGIAQRGDDFFVIDEKTTKYYPADHVKNFNPDVQMTMYILGGQIVFDKPVRGAILNVAQILQTMTHFNRSILTRSEARLNEFYYDTLEVIQRIHSYVDAGRFPLNATACGNYGGCSFRDVCGQCPDMRENILKGNFKQSEPWNPAAHR